MSESALKRMQVSFYNMPIKCSKSMHALTNPIDCKFNVRVCNSGILKRADNLSIDPWIREWFTIKSDFGAYIRGVEIRAVDDIWMRSIISQIYPF